MYWNPRNGPSLGGRRAGKALEETGRLLRWLWSRLLSLGLHAYSGTPSSWYGYTPRDNLVGSQDVQSQAQVSRTTHSRLRSVMISRVAVHEDLSHCSRYGGRGFMAQDQFPFTVWQGIARFDVYVYSKTKNVRPLSFVFPCISAYLCLHMFLNLASVESDRLTKIGRAHV